MLQTGQKKESDRSIFSKNFQPANSVGLDLKSTRLQNFLINIAEANSIKALKNLHKENKIYFESNLCNWFVSMLSFS